MLLSPWSPLYTASSVTGLGVRSECLTPESPPQAHLHVVGMLGFVSFDMKQPSLPAPFYSALDVSICLYGPYTLNPLILKLSFSPDVIPCGWLGSEHQLTKLSNLTSVNTTDRLKRCVKVGYCITHNTISVIVDSYTCHSCGLCTLSTSRRLCLPQFVNPPKGVTLLPYPHCATRLGERKETWRFTSTETVKAY